MTPSTPSDDDPAGAGAVRLRGVTKSYRHGARPVQALRGVDLAIDEPGFYAVMGPSGSGKSTLLHLIAALDRPDEGTIEIDGCQLDRLEERDLTRFRRHRIGIIFQQFNLISTLTARENVGLPGMLDGMRAAERQQRADALLASLGLEERSDHRPDSLSGGEQQRVAIARALLFEPRVVLADEPTGNLDSASSEQIWSLLERLGQEERRTVLMVTHEAAAAVHCRRVFVLRDGVIDDTFDVEGMDAGQLATRAQHARG